MIEWDGADIVVENVGFNDTMEETAADETEFTIDCCSGSTNIVPAFRGVVGKRGVSVLEVRDGNWKSLMIVGFQVSRIHIPSQWFTQRYGAKYQTAILEKP
jgi:hypothetical protein